MNSDITLLTNRSFWFVIAVKSSKLATMKRLLSLLLLLVSAETLAETGVYQVEVIVFRNLQATNESAEITELRSFSQFPDLENAEQTDKQPRESSDGSAESAEVELSNILSGYLPDDVLVVTRKSDAMDNAWRRLRSSQNYRPLIYTGWQQNKVEFYPPMRIHDQQVIETRLNPPTQIMIADLSAPDPLATYRSTFYQIDGSLQLRRSRFLHLYLDLELREVKPHNTIDSSFSDGNDLEIEIGSPAGESGNYGVFAIKQNRQITTSRMQYFDTPYLGALVYVTSIQSN